VFKPSKLLANADFHLFKTGIEPKWEDPECANGGKWSFTVSRKPQLDTMWLETVFILPMFLQMENCYTLFSLKLYGWIISFCVMITFNDTLLQ
jgi:Eukaryotic initiation factor 4E